MLAARVGVVVVAGVLAASCVNLRYPPGASRDGGSEFVAHLGTGQACGQSKECQSGFCVDGVCCKTSCSDQKCFTCAKPGNEGFCMPVEVGMPDPHGFCVDENRASCGRNGLCDGAGGCQKYPVGTVCYDSSCFSGAEVTLPSRCSSDGICEKGPRQVCAPYACVGGKCLTSCAVDDHCSRPSTCDLTDGSCRGNKALGASCTVDTDCGESGGKCRQGVCCATDCADGCMSCALAGSEGTCLPVPAGGTPTGKDLCVPTDPSTCGLDGKCDGAGACRNYIAGTKCAEASCMSATLRGAGTCDGKTHCQVPAAVSCGGFVCASTTACRTTCTEDLQCASPSVCGTIQGACGGLSAQYFRQTNLTDLAISRTDATIDFHWAVGAPNALLNKDNFSVRWHGKITPRFTEPYTFYASTDDGERLFIDGKLVIDRFIRKPADPEDVTVPIMLTAGKPVDVVLEYFESGGDATAVLSWSSNPSEPKGVIPTSALSPQ